MIILRDASVWTILVKNSENVDINNVKLLGYRANSDVEVNGVRVTEKSIRKNEFVRNITIK